MKEKFFTGLIVLVLAIAVGALFWYGQAVVSKKAQVGYSVVSFRNVDEVINFEKEEFDPLIFSIKTFEHGPRDYQVSLLVDGEDFYSFERSIDNEELFFAPAKSFLKKLEEVEADQFEYKVVFKLDDGEEFITKNIKIEK